MIREVDQLGNNIDHIREVVTMRQGHAKISGALEILPRDGLVEGAITVILGGTEHHGAIADNAADISKENLDPIFSHGFTTRKDGHGFGLHSGALAAREMGGTLTASSEGLGLGATFTLELSVAPHPTKA